MSKTYATRHAHVKQLEGVVVVKPHGEMTGGDETDEIEELIAQFDAEGVPCLIINLADVPWMNTLGINRLLAGHIKFSKRGARFCLCNVDKRIHNIFVITRLVMVFDTFPSEEAAIAGCPGKSS